MRAWPLGMGVVAGGAEVPGMGAVVVVLVVDVVDEVDVLLAATLLEWSLLERPMATPRPVARRATTRTTITRGDGTDISGHGTGRTPFVRRGLDAREAEDDERAVGEQDPAEGVQ